MNNNKNRLGRAVELATEFAMEIGAPAMWEVLQDESFKNKGEPQWGSSLFDLLDKIEWVSNIDYDGHFGSRVFFTVDEAGLYPQRVQQVEQAIRDRVIQMMGEDYWNRLVAGNVECV